MWTLAYGLIALAVMAFVVLYAATHAPAPAAVDLADQLYHAKRWLAQNLPLLPRTEKETHLLVYDNAVMVRITNATAYDPVERRWTTYPVALPLAYRLDREERNIVYQLFLNVTICRGIVASWGEPTVLYVIEVRHSLDYLPWVETYAAVAENTTAYYNGLYGYYKAWGRPVAVGLDPDIGADRDLGVRLVRAVHAFVYNATDAVTKMYVAAPASTLYILVVDYPLKLPLSCPNFVETTNALGGEVDFPRRRN